MRALEDGALGDHLEIARDLVGLEFHLGKFP